MISTRAKPHRTPEGNANRSRGRMARFDAIAAEMYAFYQQGHTLQEVGEKFHRPWTSVHALFRSRGLARRSRHAPEVYQRIAATRRARLDPLIARMHLDYLRPMSLNAVGRKYGRSNGAVRELFVKRGLEVRPFKELARQPNGSPVRKVITPEQLDALIAGMTNLRVPPALKVEWRRWSLARRGEFIARARAKLARPTDRPMTPFSSNVEPFDYSSTRAHEIVARMNVGTDSRSARVKIDICSQGVIFRDRLWFWAAKVGYESGPWTPEHCRPSLHKTLWEEAHGRKMPAGHVIRFVDGNPNNLVPENLRLATRNDVARENQAAHLLRKSRELTGALLHRFQNPNRNALSDCLLTPSR